MRRIAVVVVVLHALALIGHEVAHRGLGVGLSRWQWACAYSVIVAAPILAVGVTFSRYARRGYLLLAVSMFSSLLFTVYHQYVLVSPDHVSHLPDVGDPWLFRWTAAALAILELVGGCVGLAAWRRQVA